MEIWGIQAIEKKRIPLTPEAIVDLPRLALDADAWTYAGHVSFWREKDRAIIGGDAFITTNQESAYAVAMQKPELHGPSKYFTVDWTAARDSVNNLAALNPELVVTGHGRAMRGLEMREALHALARDFDQVAVAEGGRYVAKPARAADGSAYRQQ